MNFTKFHGAIIATMVVSSCNGSFPVVAGNNSNLDNSIVIEKAAVIPALDGRATPAGIYIRNTSGKTISGISYALEQPYGPTTSLSIDGTSCNTIEANHSCLLPLTTPALTAGDSGGNIIVANYNKQQSKQLVNYRYLDTRNYSGVNFSDMSQNLFGSGDYATIYVFSGNRQKLYDPDFKDGAANIAFNQSNNSLTITSGLLGGKVNIPADTLIPLEIHANPNVSSNRVTLTPYTLTSGKEVQQDLRAGTENNGILTVTIIPARQGNLLLSDLPALTNDTPSATLSIFNNGNQPATISRLRAGDKNITVAPATSNPCPISPATLAAGASCNYTITKNNDNNNGSVLLTLAYNNTLTASLATQTAYYQNTNALPMVAATATQTGLSGLVNRSSYITFNIINSGNVLLHNAVINVKTTLQNTVLTINKNTCGEIIGSNASCSLQVGAAASGLVDNGVIYLKISGTLVSDTTTSYSFMSKPVYISIINS